MPPNKRPFSQLSQSVKPSWPSKEECCFYARIAKLLVFLFPWLSAFSMLVSAERCLIPHLDLTWFCASKNAVSTCHSFLGCDSICNSLTTKCGSPRVSRATTVDWEERIPAFIMSSISVHSSRISFAILFTKLLNALVALKPLFPLTRSNSQNSPAFYQSQVSIKIGFCQFCLLEADDVCI